MVNPQCRKCKVDMTADNSYRGRNYCKPCCTAWQLVYSRKPEVVAKRNTPEAKAKKKAYDATPESKARHKAYNSTPEAKAKKKAYDATPVVKARKKAYRAERIPCPQCQKVLRRDGHRRHLKICRV